MKNYEEIDFSKFTSIKIGPKSLVYIVEKEEILSDETIIIGAGYNLLISQNPPPLAMLSSSFDFINEHEESLTIGAKTSSAKTLLYAKKNNLRGFEILQRLPGTIGGMIKMNAGLKENTIFDNLLGVYTSQGYFAKEQIEHSYRSSKIGGVIYKAKFAKKLGFDFEKLEEFKNARSNQPNMPSAGSCFKNPPNNFAGKLLQEVNMKGKRVGNMGFSDIHANFLVNFGGGTFEDAISLIQEAKKKVWLKFNIKLECEIHIIH